MSVFLLESRFSFFLLLGNVFLPQPWKVREVLGFFPWMVGGWDKNSWVLGLGRSIRYTEPYPRVRSYFNDLRNMFCCFSGLFLDISWCMDAGGLSGTQRGRHFDSRALFFFLTDFLYECGGNWKIYTKYLINVNINLHFTNQTSK